MNILKMRNRFLLMCIFIVFLASCKRHGHTELYYEMSNFSYTENRGDICIPVGNGNGDTAILLYDLRDLYNELYADTVEYETFFQMTYEAVQHNQPIILSNEEWNRLSDKFIDYNHEIYTLYEQYGVKFLINRLTEEKISSIPSAALTQISYLLMKNDMRLYLADEEGFIVEGNGFGIPVIL